MTATDLESAYEDCLALARSHYENFPVASLLVPKRLRKPIAAIYAFARRADDIADEGDRIAAKRITELTNMENQLRSTLQGNSPRQPLYLAVQDTIETHHLDPQYFYDLIDAFKQDAEKKRYQDFNEVLHYCQRSANPVGRLMLQLAGEDTPENNRDSDAICSALQLINFMQDIQQDLNENNRIYFPQDEMLAAGVSDNDFTRKSSEAHVIAFVQEQTKRARDMLNKGSGLGHRLAGRFGLEIRTITHGGLTICDALLKQGDEIYSRPRLGRLDKTTIIAKALLRL